MASPIKLEPGANVNNQRIVNVASPSATTDAVNKAYVDNLVSGLSWKADVRAATTTNGTLATAFANSQTVDGVTLVTGDRILVKNQTTQTENGIYVVAVSGAPTRATDADSTTELNNATVSVLDGTANSQTSWTQATKNPTIGSSNIVWGTYAAGQTYTADGNGIELSANQFSLELDGSTLTKGSSGLRVGSGAAGAGLVEASGVLAVGQGTGITVNVDDVAIDPSVVVRKYATSFGDGSATTYVVTHNLGTKDIDPSFRENATDTVILLDWTATSTTTMTVNCAVAPTTNAIRAAVKA